MKKQIWIPVSVGVLLIALLLTMALTDLFQPVITFIHTQKISPIQAIICVLAAMLGFYLVFKVLAKLGEYFLPKE